MFADARRAADGAQPAPRRAAARSPSWPTTGTATGASSRRAARPSPRCSRTTAIARRPWASGTIPRPNRPPPPVPSITGRPGYGFRIFLRLPRAAKRRSTSRTSCGTRPTSNTPTRPGGHNYYHLSEDLADDAINWLRQHKAFAPDKPFFMYWASGASHGPHHVPKEWADKYKGKFDDGWDKYRERAFQRAKELGWIPQNAELTAAARPRCRPGRRSPRTRSRFNAA